MKNFIIENNLDWFDCWNWIYINPGWTQWSAKTAKYVNDVVVSGIWALNYAFLLKSGKLCWFQDEKSGIPKIYMEIIAKYLCNWYFNNSSIYIISNIGN